MRAALLFLVISAIPAGALAQDGGAGALDGGVPERDPEMEAFRRMVDSDPFTQDVNDPIGLDARDDEMRTMRLPEPEEIVEERIPPQTGQVLTAIAGVRETEHAMSIELRAGIAIVREEMRFVSSARLPAEVRYRLAVPDGGALVALEACNEAGCRTGLPDRSTSALSAYDDAARWRGTNERPLPIAHAAATRDDRGPAIVVRAAPIVEGSAPLVVRVTWAVRTPVRGGRIETIVPARGQDARVTEVSVRVRAIDLVAPVIDTVPAERVEMRPAGSPIAIGAVLPATAGVRGSAGLVPCGGGRCARLRVVAGRPQIEAGDVVIAIDASPSTIESARGRIAPTVRALLAMLPARSRVRVIAFAARAEEVSSGWSAPTAIDRAAIDAAIERSLGSATRFEALWGAISAEMRSGTRVVIVGDGGWTEGEASRAAIAAARAARVVLASVDVADRPSTPALRAAIEGAGFLAIDAGQEAEDAAAGRAEERLVARITAVVAPVAVREVSVRIGGERIALGPLRAGEEIAWEGIVRGGAQVSMSIDASAVRGIAASADTGPSITALVDGGATSLVAVDARDVARSDGGSCHAQGPYATYSTVVPREVPLALAHSRRCDPAPSMSLGPRAERRRTGIPARVLLQTLRRRVIPAARGCFRADRGGRADYQERAEIRLELADREIVGSGVEGEIEGELRTCLLSALDNLEVPGFEGRVIVRWPLYTAAAMPPPVLEFAPTTADEVDRILPRE